MLKYKEMKVSSSKFRERNDCVVIALAIVSGKTYEEARQILKKNGRQDRKGTYRYAIQKSVLEVNPNAEFEYITKPCGGQYTSRTIGKALPKGNYIVLFRSHAAAMVDGVIEDWSDGRCMRVQEIIKL
jgi:hypothetical protein